MHRGAALPRAALIMKLVWRQLAPSLICHTDQGMQCAAAPYWSLLAKHRIQPNMIRKGNCYDNAVAESFFSNLKNEATHYRIYSTRKETKATIFDYIELFYSRLGPHQTLGYQTPVECEAKLSLHCRLINLSIKTELPHHAQESPYQPGDRKIRSGYTRKPVVGTWDPTPAGLS